MSDSPTINDILDMAKIEAGRLVELLADHAPPTTPIQMLFPPSRAQPRRVRALADQLAFRLQIGTSPK